MRDHYEVLGVAKTASLDDIRAAFKRIAAESHPDTHPGDAAAEARFKEANAAAQVLSDPAQRSFYDRQDRLRALRSEVEATEAQARASADDAEERALTERLEAARLAVRRATMMRMVDHQRKAAEVSGDYIVAPFDMEAETPGAGLYVLRSPARSVWKSFQAAIAEAGADAEKVDTAYNNLASACMLWSDAPGDPDGWAKHRAKYAVLVQAIGDAAGRLGGAADRARKR